MRKLVLTSFRFKTGENTYEEKHLVVVNTKPDNSDEDLITACEQVQAWFPKRYPESELLSVVAHPTIDNSDSVVKENRDSIFVKPFNATVFPPMEAEKESDSSDDVLIDVDGIRKTFVIGWYDYGTKEWSNRDQYPLDLEHMKWFYLPLAKYDKK